MKIFQTMMMVLVVTGVMAITARSADAAVFAISFQSSDIDETGTGGLFWNGVTGDTPTITNIVATDGVTLTGVSLTTTNGGGFTAGNRGLNAPITENGITFPGAANDGYVADNLGATGRDGLMVFRFTAPNLAEFAEWEFTIVGSYDNNNPGDNAHIVKYNIGGTYASKDFTGGETLTLDIAPVGDNINAGVLSGTANFDGSNYIIDLQVGYAGSGNSSVGAINALHVSTNQVIPEPASLALLSLGGIALLARRRRTC